MALGTDVAITHKFVSAKADGADGTLVQPSKWNQNENLGGGTDGQLLVRDSLQVDGASWIPFLRSYLAGCGLSNDGGTPLTVLDVAAGLAASDDSAPVPMSLAAITGSISGTWVVGSGNNKLDTGVIAASTWYHVWVIMRMDTSVVDILFSLSATAPTLPTNYTKKRRIGSFRTNASSQIIAFVQDGDYFRWAAVVVDDNTTNPGTAARTITLTVPPGVTVQAMLLPFAVSSTAATTTTHYLSDLAANDETPGTGFGTVEAGSAWASGANVIGPILIRTNTSAQIRSRTSFSDANVAVGIRTVGWFDTRGKNA